MNDDDKSVLLPAGTEAEESPFKITQRYITQSYYAKEVRDAQNLE
jgi:hypothetical protein